MKIQLEFVVRLLVLTTVLILPASAQFTGCFRDSRCRNVISGFTSAEECCLSDNGMYYNDGSTCQQCIVYGWVDTELVAAEAVGAHSVRVGYIKGTGSRLRLNIETIHGTTSPNDIIVNSQVLLPPGNIDIFYVVDSIAQEVREEATLRLSLLSGSPPTGSFIRSDLRLIVDDSDSVVIEFNQDDYIANERSDLFVTVRKFFPIANPVKLSITPLTVGQYLGMPEVKRPALEEGQLAVLENDGLPFSPNRATANQDFSPNIISITFGADERGRRVDDISFTVRLFDDAIDEADPELFVLVLSVVNAINTTGIVLRRPVSIGKINDNDDIVIGFERSSYTFGEPLTFREIELSAVRLAKENNQISEQTYVILIYVVPNVPPNSGLTPATRGNAGDFDILGSRTVNTVVTIGPSTQTQTIPITLFNDNTPESTEAFQLIITPVSARDNSGPPYTQPSADSTVFPSTYIIITNNNLVAQFTGCFSNSRCSNSLTGFTSAEECCLSDNGIYYNDGSTCQQCVVYGWVQTELVAAEAAGAHSARVGYIKGTGSRLILNIKTIHGTTSDDDIIVSSQVALLPGNIDIFYVVDSIAQEVREEATLRLSLLSGNPPAGSFLRSDLRLIVDDSDSVIFEFNQDDYITNERSDLTVTVRKLLPIANPVNLLIRPLSVGQYLAMPEENRPNLEEGQLPVLENDGLPFSPNRATANMDFSPNTISITFGADSEGRRVDDISSTIQLFDDEIDEADPELFVLVLQVVSAVNTTGVVLRRPTSIGMINDNDDIVIGFERSSYTFGEPPFEIVINDVQIVKENNMITEQTYIVVFSFLPNVPPNSGFTPATRGEGGIGSDFDISGSQSGVGSTILIGPRTQTESISIFLFGDNTAEGTESFQLFLSPVPVRDDLGPQYTQPSAGSTVFPSTYIIINDDDGCSQLPAIANGKISYQRNGQTVSATYSCNRFYTIVGSSVRTCRRPGQFSGSAPRCAPICQSPPALQNGRITFSPDTTGPEYDLNTVATYICNRGYQLNTNSGNQRRTCVDGGTGNGGRFSGTAPSCERITVMFAQSSYTFNENGGSGTLEVITSAPTSAAFQVTVTGGPSTQSGIIRSAQAISQTKTFTVGSSSLLFDLTILDDEVAGEDVEFYDARLTISAGSNSVFQLGTRRATRVNVVDDDGPSTQNSIANASSISQVKRFQEGSISLSFDFILNDDDFGLESVEVFVVTLSLVGSPMGIVVGGRARTTVNVLDDDAVSVGIEETSYTVSDSDGMVEITYELNRVALQDVTIHVENIDVTAETDRDYDSSSYNLTIPAGSTSVTGSIAIVDDGIPGERQESFVNTINSASPSAVTIAIHSALVFITDPDVSMKCPVGTYEEELSSGETTCVPCPDNSMSTMEGSRECTCLDGYYRTALEGPNLPCMSRPSSCRNLQVVEERTRASTITVRWERPEITGRDDFYYNIFYSEDNQTFIQHNSRPYMKQDALVDYSLSGLTSFTTYTIRVTAENGVSDQEGGDTRSCFIIGQTGGTRANAPSTVHGFCTVVVWTSPTRTYGRITGYDLNFVLSGAPNVTVTKRHNELFHMIGDEVAGNDQINTLVQVRAKTPSSVGRWSGLVSLGCNEQPTCSP